MSNIIKAGQTSQMEFKPFSPSNFLKSGPSPKVPVETPFFKPLESSGEKDLNGGEKDLNGERNLKEKIDSFIKEAEERTAVIKEKAYQEGFNQGKIDGSEETAKRLESIADNLTRLLSEMDCSKEEMLKGEEQYVKQLVMTIAQKVILHEISINKDAIKKAVKETLKYVSDKSLVHIKVNPEDLEHLATYKQDFLTCVKDLKNLDLIGDEEIAPGGFLIETGFETIDGRIEQKLDTISKIVEEELSKS
jgi:flagellar assembly protein FliH